MDGYRSLRLLAAFRLELNQHVDEKTFLFIWNLRFRFETNIRYLYNWSSFIYFLSRWSIYNNKSWKENNVHNNLMWHDLLSNSSRHIAHFQSVHCNHSRFRHIYYIFLDRNWDNGVAVQTRNLSRLSSLLKLWCSEIYNSSFHN